MKNFKQPGMSIEVDAPAGGVVSGNAFIVGSLFLVAAITAAAGKKVNGDRVGVFELPKLAADVDAVGDKLNWDDTAKHLKKAAGDLDKVVTVVKAADATKSLVEVVLTPV